MHRIPILCWAAPPGGLVVAGGLNLFLYRPVALTSTSPNPMLLLFPSPILVASASSLSTALASFLASSL